jgi:hypothetical protein
VIRSRSAPSSDEDQQASTTSRLLAFNLIGIGGVLGAYARYWLGLRMTDAWGGGFPWGTLIINVTGCGRRVYSWH